MALNRYLLATSQRESSAVYLYKLIEHDITSSSPCQYEPSPSILVFIPSSQTHDSDIDSCLISHTFLGSSVPLIVHVCRLQVLPSYTSLPIIPIAEFGTVILQAPKYDPTSLDMS
jgi:hypothetical protein